MIAAILDEEGEGPPVIYVPGMDASGELLLETAKSIRGRFRLVRLHYLSEAEEARPEDPYKHLASSIADVTKHLGPALIVAESFGGAVALQLALDYPQRFVGLMIVNSFAHYSPRFKIALSRLLTPIVPGSVFAHGRRFFAPKTLFGDRQEKEAIAAFQVIEGVRFDKGYRRRLRMIQKLDLRPRLSEIQQPIALYAGDKDLVVESQSEMAEMATALPNATFEIVEGGGHIILPLDAEPWVERLEAVAARAGI